VQTVGVTKNVVTSMGGIRVLPDLSISEVQPKLTSILILPGGDVWMREDIQEVTRLIKDLIASDRPVAAICAATLSLARAGLLDDRRHTSDGCAFIPKYVARYRGQGLYQRVRAVADGNVITANGLAPFAFAAEIFRKLAPDRENDIAIYETLYSRGLLDDLHNNKPETKKRLVSVDIKPDYLYSPQEVAAVLSVSYDTAARIMGPHGASRQPCEAPSEEAPAENQRQRPPRLHSGQTGRLRLRRATQRLRTSAGNPR
jgi:putative intracellular protease/amidase